MVRNPRAGGRSTNQPGRRGFSLRFVGETVAELRRVTWPTRQETVRLTVMVMCVAAVVGLFLGLVDLGFARLMDWVLR